MEADVELLAREDVGVLGVGQLDRRAAGDLPRQPAVGLEEERVALGLLEDELQGLGPVLDPSRSAEDQRLRRRSLRRPTST